jgi:opacity protein-like surface antigen
MKKSFLVLAVSLFLISSSLAQVKISGGGLIGLNFGGVSVDPTPQGESFGGHTGLGIGGVLNFGFANGFGISAEPMYLQKGSDISVTGQTTSATIKANYIEIPVMLTYTFETGAGQIEPYVMAGPSLGIRLSATLTVNNQDTDIKDQTSSTDFGATLGAGARYPMGKNRIFLEARYAFGFSNINNTPGDNTSIKTHGFMIFAGITFPFGS